MEDVNCQTSKLLERANYHLRVVSTILGKFLYCLAKTVTIYEAIFYTDSSKYCYELIKCKYSLKPGSQVLEHYTEFIVKLDYVFYEFI